MLKYKKTNFIMNLSSRKKNKIQKNCFMKIKMIKTNKFFLKLLELWIKWKKIYLKSKEEAVQQWLNKSLKLPKKNWKICIFHSIQSFKKWNKYFRKIKKESWRHI
jgi:hypothetical protein